MVDVFVFIPMAIFGGLMGALWVAAQKRITMYRMRLKLTIRQRMAEVRQRCHHVYRFSRIFKLDATPRAPLCCDVPFSS